MIYKNSEMRIDQILAYFNEKKINLSPVFQRGHVWKIGLRRSLLKNMVLGMPIPAIFLYKDKLESDTRYSYNILDGKQRLESLILFVAATREDPQIPKWREYFFEERHRAEAGFWVDLPEGKTTFKQLSADSIAHFREYAIPTIEITLDERSSLDQVIGLFVDINQKGEPVGRFKIVTAMGQSDPLLMSVFGLLAIKQLRKQDVFYKVKSNEFNSVLQHLQTVSSMADRNARVDRMWERLLEIAMFCRTKTHRKPVDVLKSFINPAKSIGGKRLTGPEVKNLRRVFSFLKDAYAGPLVKSRLATDNTHFYTMVTSLLSSDLLEKYTKTSLVAKLNAFAKIVEGKNGQTVDKRIREDMTEYLKSSVRQTTDATRREERQRIFYKVIAAL